MTSRIRIVQDRRTVSRVVADLECQCTCKGVNYHSNLINLSLKGAFLSSRFEPPKSGDVVITLKTPLLKKPLVMDARLLRVGVGISERGSRYRFGVRFDYTPLDLVELVNKLISLPSRHPRMP